MFPSHDPSGYGWGTYFFGGRTIARTTTTMNNGGTLASGTTAQVILTDASSFPESGVIRIGSEDIAYASKSSNTLQTLSRGQNGTSPANHADGSTVTDITNDIAWGEASASSNVIIDPANWSLDNFGNILIATVHNGETFTWDASASNQLNTRSLTIVTGKHVDKQKRPRS